MRVQNTDLSRTFQKSSIINRSQREAILWHHRFGHIKNLSDLYHVTKLKKAIQHAIFHYDVCHLAKSKKRRNHTISQRSDTLLDRISVDVCGKLPKGAKGHIYFLMIIDSYSHYVAAIPAKGKDDCADELRIWKKEAELHTGFQLKAVRMDNVKELLAVGEEWKKDTGVKIEPTAPYTSSQNGLAERAIQGIEQKARAMLIDANLPITFWPYAVTAAAYITNLTATGPMIDERRITPHQAWYNEVPSIDHLRIWGSKVVVHIPKKKRKSKLHPASELNIFVKYTNTPKQYLVYLIKSDKTRIYDSSIVVFDESTMGSTAAGLSSDLDTYDLSLVRESNGLPRIIDNVDSQPTLGVIKGGLSSTNSASPNPCRLTRSDRGLSSPVGASNTKDTSTDIGRATYSGSVGAPTRIAIVINNAPTQRDVPDHSIVADNVVPGQQQDVITKALVLADTPVPKSTPLGLSITDKPPVKPGSIQDNYILPEQRHELAPPSKTSKHQLSLDGQFNHNENNHSKNNHSENNRIIDVKDTVMPDVSKPRKKASRFEDHTDEPKRKSARVYYTIKDEVSAHTNNTTSHGINNPIPIPTSYRSAVDDPIHGAAWKEAVQTKLNAIASNDTFRIVKKPHGVNIVTARWVWNVKYTEQHAVNRYKARLVARGFT